MENKDKTIEHEDSEPSTGVKNTVSTYQEAQVWSDVGYPNRFLKEGTSLW